MKNVVSNPEKELTIFYIRFLDGSFLSSPIHLNDFLIADFYVSLV